jgi:hypothetical protein
VEELIPVSIVPELRARIAHAAGGNPLFLTEMAAMAAGTGAEVLVPPNLQALLAARLDQLDTSERSVLERGAVEGEIFHRGSVQALSGDGTVVPEAGRTGSKGADPAPPDSASRRRRVPLPPPAHPRRCL